MMKKALCVCLVLAIAGLVAPASASYYLAGQFNGWNAAGNEMMETSSGSGIWSLSLTGLEPGQRQEFKVTNGSWDWNYPGANSWFYADAAGSITITFNTNIVSDGWLPEQYRLGLSAPINWTIAGSFNVWNNAAAEGAMTAQGDGTYKLSLTLAPGTYYFKPVVTGTWDSLSVDGRSVNTSDMSVTTTEGFQVVNFYVDDLNGAVRTEVIPEPATMTLLALGSVLLTAARRRK